MNVGQLIEALQDYGDHLPVKVLRIIEATGVEYRYSDLTVSDESDPSESSQVVTIDIEPKSATVRR